MDSVASQSQQKDRVPVINRLHHWFIAVCIVGGTAATLVSVIANPGYYHPHTDVTSFIAAFATAPTFLSQTHVISMIFVSYLLPLGLLAMAWLALPRAPWWASSAALLIILGLWPVAAFAGQDSLGYDIARMGSNPLLLTLARQFDRDGVMSYYNVMFAIGSIFGPTLLGIALWRARAIPLWAALLITISRPLAFLYPLLPVQWQVGFLVQIPSCLLLFIGNIPAAMAILKGRDGQDSGESRKGL